MKKTAERILLDDAYEIIADLGCDCGIFNSRSIFASYHKGNCQLMLKQKWLAKYELAGLHNPPRYDEVFEKGTAWLDRIARGEEEE